MPAWVRVRREDFGLLFYDTRSTRLTYVRSGAVLEPPPFTGERRLLRPTTPLGADVLRLLDDLITKGLIVVRPPE